MVAGDGARDMRPQFRLRAGQDDLLIEWLTSFAPRQRSQAIREALQGHVLGKHVPGDHVPGQDPTAERDGGQRVEDPSLAAALDALF